MMTAIRWKPIEDLPTEWPSLVSSELQSLAQIWQTQAVRLGQSAALRQFNEQLNREWAIETGIIENLYSIDRDTTQLLIENKETVIERFQKWLNTILVHGLSRWRDQLF